MNFAGIIHKLRSASPERHLPGFDEIYYRYWYRDIRQSPHTPLQHYLRRGWREGRDPSAGFSSDGYLASNPDVKISGFNPLLHFLEFGLAEGRKGWEKDPKLPAPIGRYFVESGPQKLLAPPTES